jgi:hypothetical protein
MMGDLQRVITRRAFRERLKRRITPDQRLRPLAKGEASNAIESLKRSTGVTLVQINHFVWVYRHNAFVPREAMPCWQTDYVWHDIARSVPAAIEPCFAASQLMRR